MNAKTPPSHGDTSEEVAALIEVLLETGQRLEDLTAGEIDTVSDREGRTVVLRNAQEQLRHINAARQAAVLDALPAHIALVDTRGFITSVNEAWRKFAVANKLQSPGYAVGVNYLEICDGARGNDADEALQVAAGIRAVLDGKAKRFSLEYPCHSPAEQRWFLLTVTPLADDRRNGAAVMHVNITGPKQTEAALQRRQTELRVLFDLLPAMIWFKDTENRILRVNKKVALAAGKSVAEIEGRPSLEIYPQDAAKFYADDLEVIRSGVPKLAIVETLQGADGKAIWVQTDKVPVLSEDGKVLGICVMAQDITQRKGTEHRIAYLNRVYAMLSGINALIVHVQDRQTLFDGVCRIAVEVGKFGTAWVGTFDSATFEVTPAAWANEAAEKLTTPSLNRGTDVEKGTGVVSRAIREKRTVFDNDIEASAGVNTPRRAEAVRAGFHSLVVVPFVIGGAVVGHLSMYARERGFFNEEELQLLNGLAGDISFALANIDKEEKIARMARVKAVTSGINSLIVRVRERQELFDEACRIAVEQGGFGIAWLGTFDPVTQDITPVAWAGIGSTIASTRRSSRADIPEGQGLSGRAVREKKAVFDNDIVQHADIGGGGRKEAINRGYGSLIALPLLLDGAVLGTLSLFAIEPEFFDAEEVTLLTELAGNISFAIGDISKEEKIVRLSRVKSVTSGINSLIVRFRERQELFDEVCRVAVAHGKFDTAWIGTFDSAKLEVSRVAWATPAGESLALVGTTWPVDVAHGAGVGSRAIREMRPVFDNDIAADTAVRNPRRLEAVQAGFHSIIVLPLMTAGAVMGQLSLYSKERDFFTEDEVALLAELAGNISFALEHIDREEKLAKLSRIRAVSGEINAAIVRIAERESLLREVCRIAVEVGKFDLVWIGALDGKAETVQSIAWAGFPSPVVQLIEWDLLTGPNTTLAESMRTGKISVRNDLELQTSAGLLRMEAVKQGCRSAICLPLMLDGNIDAYILLYAPGVNFFDHDELALLDEVTADISLALQSIARRKQLDYLAYYDVLTGLANRALFHERLEQGLTAAKERGRKLALVLLDIERFKIINDTLGRQTGDELLKAVAVRIREYVPDVGRLARLDADHFALIASDIQSGEDLARLIEQRDGEIFGPSFRIGDADLRISAKFGIAMFPADGEDADTLFRNAEAALKNAKTKGDRYLFYAHAMNARVAEKLSVEYRLRQAIEREEFVLHYQPKVSLASGKLTSAEALIRWNDPQSGLVPPGQFIPILEETGLINEVGRWALKRAIADYLRWRAAGLPAVRIAVNVSPLQLRNRDFVAEIKRNVGIDAHAAEGLELEITESVIMDDVKRNIASLQTIRDLGVTIAIDDFGTGFSSLSYLAKLPVDTLKIDRAFVVDMTASPEGLALVSTIINLAHALGRKVVAEGVETEEQSRLLRLLNCDEMQGYLFSKPVPADIFETRFLMPDANEPAAVA
jgi:diguanylate cyclase (GGDEF)-like protein/PAS domain S-box-containing protein